jgi:hypothetical protein
VLISDSTRDLARDLISRGGEVLGNTAVDAHEARALVRISPDEAPVEFVIDLLGLQRFVESAQGSARDVFPDVDPTEGGLRLLSEHLWEEIGSAGAGVVTVGVDRQGVTWRRTELSPQRSNLPAGDYRWTADRDVSPESESDPHAAPR